MTMPRPGALEELVNTTVRTVGDIDASSRSATHIDPPAGSPDACRPSPYRRSSGVTPSGSGTATAAVHQRHSSAEWRRP